MPGLDRRGRELHADGLPLSIGELREIYASQIRSQPLHLAELLRAARSERRSEPLRLSRFTEIDLHMVQLVRDPRGVAFSFNRKKAEPRRQTGFPRVDPFRISAAWTLRNAFLESRLRRSLGERYMLLRYED
jgi:hypothetical protein